MKRFEAMKVNWSLGNIALSEKFGVKPGAVSQVRSRVFGRKDSGRIYHGVDWARINWRKNDSGVSKEAKTKYGVEISAKAVGVLRKEFFGEQFDRELKFLDKPRARNHSKSERCAVSSDRPSWSLSCEHGENAVTLSCDMTTIRLEVNIGGDGILSDEFVGQLDSMFGYLDAGEGWSARKAEVVVGNPGLSADLVARFTDTFLLIGVRGILIETV